MGYGSAHTLLCDVQPVEVSGCMDNELILPRMAGGRWRTGRRRTKCTKVPPFHFTAVRSPFNSKGHEGKVSGINQRRRLMDGSDNCIFSHTPIVIKVRETFHPFLYVHALSDVLHSLSVSIPRLPFFSLTLRPPFTSGPSLHKTMTAIPLSVEGERTLSTVLRGPALSDDL